MSGPVLPRSVPIVGGVAGKPMIAAGLFGLAAVLRGVWMLAGSMPTTTLDWVTLALTARRGREPRR